MAEDEERVSATGMGGSMVSWIWLIEGLNREITTASLRSFTCLFFLQLFVAADFFAFFVGGSFSLSGWQIG